MNIAGSAMGAQSVRLNTTASNLANAESASSTPEGAYQAKHPVFKAVIEAMNEGQTPGGVEVSGIAQSNAQPLQQYQPNHPMADAEGYVYMPNVNAVQELANMMSASRSYQNNVEAFNTSKQLLLRTLSLGQ
jgi:flagellar basal-body rod protein FlgC